MLTDWAAMGSLPPDQAAKYQPAVVPDSATIQERLQQAVPAMVVALSSMLSSMRVSNVTNFSHLCWMQMMWKMEQLCLMVSGILAEPEYYPSTLILESAARDAS